MPKLICTYPKVNEYNESYYEGLYLNESPELTTGRVYFTAPTTDIYNGFYCRKWIQTNEAIKIIQKWSV